MITLYRRTNTWFHRHPALSAATFLAQSALLGTAAVWASAHHELVFAVVAYVVALGAAIDGALEVRRASVSAGGAR